MQEQGSHSVSSHLQTDCKTVHSRDEQENSKHVLDSHCKQNYEGGSGKNAGPHEISEIIRRKEVPSLSLAHAPTPIKTCTGPQGECFKRGTQGLPGEGSLIRKKKTWPERSSDMIFDTEGLHRNHNMLKKNELAAECSALLSMEVTREIKQPKYIKSFSHELGPRGRHYQPLPRAHSDNNLEELWGALQARFHSAKEEADKELSVFAANLMEILDSDTDLLPGWKGEVEDLLILARRCALALDYDFQQDCKGIVQELLDKRQELPMGLLKQLHSRMLFILTRYARLFQFQKENETQGKSCIEKIEQCLREVPCVERVCMDGKKSGPAFSRRKVCCDLPRPSQQDELQPFVKGKNFEDSNSFVCRICEEDIPMSYLEAHSALCAFADACDGYSSNIDERLMSLADLLESLPEGSSPKVCQHGLEESLDVIKVPVRDMHDCSSSCSPTLSEVHGKASCARFNDLYPMEMIGVNEARGTNSPAYRFLITPKSDLQSMASSLAGSLTPRSTITTPRTSHLDLLWAERSSFVEPEDIDQIYELADIARCAASKAHENEGEMEYLNACIHDLQVLLGHCNNTALAVGTFGRHIEGLLREKHMLTHGVFNHQNLLMGYSSFNNVDASNDGCAEYKPTAVHVPCKDRTTIDDFDILKPISRGAYGRVFLAKKRTTGDLFAIKVLRKIDMIRKNAVESILAERDILITVCNPFVVRFFYSFTSMENLYLVMEYLNGGDLYSLLRNMGCLHEHVACVYMAELVLALEYLHSLGVVHRDLKPDNILIAHDGHIKLTDFGLSRVGLISSTENLSKLDTEMMSVSDHHQGRSGHKRQVAVGTPDYLAPEILLGKEHGHSADWWATGVILFECLTGLPPFNAEHPQIIFDNICNRNILWPPPEYMSDEARHLIDKLLVENPDQRLGSNGALQVKAHPFFRGINWETLAMQKAAFVPRPKDMEDTSYFTSRPLNNVATPHTCSSQWSHSSTSTLPSTDQVDEEDDLFADLTEFQSSSLARNHFNNFSFKNLSQLASMNYDLLSDQA